MSLDLEAAAARVDRLRRLAVALIVPSGEFAEAIQKDTMALIEEVKRLASVPTAELVDLSQMEAVYDSNGQIIRLEPKERG